jgi:hypothetical protein
VSLWGAFGLGVLAGMVAAGALRLLRDTDHRESGWPVDPTRPALQWYADGKTGVESWRRPRE